MFPVGLHGSYMAGQSSGAQQAQTTFIAASNISFLCAGYNHQYFHVHYATKSTTSDS
jgi:hypothetical protein